MTILFYSFKMKINNTCKDFVVILRTEINFAPKIATYNASEKSNNIYIYLAVTLKYYLYITI